MDKKRFLKKTVYLLSAFLLLLPVLAFAFEIDYPVIPGVPSPSDLLSFINYLYYFLLIAGAMVSSLSLIYGGVIYLFSSGNPGKTFFARQQIFASFLGLAIILLSFLILKILNPDVAILKIPGLNYPVNQPLISPSRPKELTIAFYELPMGVLQERVLQKTQAITSPVNYPEIIASDVRTIEQKSKELRTLLNQCKCSNLKPDCDTNCSALECVTAIGGEPTQLDLCPNLAAIEAKQQEIKNEQKKLKSHQRALKIAQLKLELASGELGVARALLSACLPSPMDKKAFLGVKDTGGIVVKIFFTDAVQTKVHPITFYCQLDDEFVKTAWEAWQQFYKSILSRMVSGGWCNCNSTLPPGVLPPGPGTIGQIYVFADPPTCINSCYYPINPMPWSSSGKQDLAQGAATFLSSYSAFLSYMMPVSLCYAPRFCEGASCPTGIWYGCNNGYINLYDAGLTNLSTAIYILAHESGHTIENNHADLYQYFKTSTAGEALTRYAAEYSGESAIVEDFAETLGLYASDILYGGSYPDSYDFGSNPNHLAFAEAVFGTAGGGGGGGGGGGIASINCDQSAPDITLPYSLNKQAYYNLVHNVWYNAPVEGNHALECYNDTVGRARAASINPAFALAIWANESNASNYNISDQDFGVNDCSVCGYNAQINQFFHLIELNPSCPGMNRMESFLQNYRTGNCTDPEGQKYIETIEFAWSAVTSCPFPSSPTDTSCY